MNRVVKPGDEIHVVVKYLGFTDKTNPNKPYLLFRMEGSTVCYNQRDEVVCKGVGWAMVQLIYPGDSEAMGDTVFGSRQKRPHYTKKQLNALHKWYDDEVDGKNRCGADIRYWEDVKEGEEMPMVMEGPLQLGDSMASGAVGGGGRGGAFAAGWAGLKPRLEHLSIDPETGEYDSAGWHYMDFAAQDKGLPRALGFGKQSEASLAHIICNWMGDDGWVKRLNIQDRGVRLYGDMAYLKGNIVRKYVEDGEHVVDLDCWSENQDGVIIVKGTATVKLISRED
jgi:hypothetical protein